MTMQRPHTSQHKQSLQHSHIAHRSFHVRQSKSEPLLQYNPEILSFISQNKNDKPHAPQEQ